MKHRIDVCQVALALATVVAAAPVLADNCSGEFTFQGTGAGPADMGAGKASSFTSISTVSSTDTPYNGAGHCSGYTYEEGGKTYSADVCVRVTPDGDSWGTFGVMPAGAKRGEWRAAWGTGKFAKNAGSVGWYEVLATDEKGGRGKWGGNCLGVK